MSVKFRETVQANYQDGRGNGGGGAGFGGGGGGGGGGGFGSGAFGGAFGSAAAQFDGSSRYDGGGRGRDMGEGFSPRDYRPPGGKRDKHPLRHRIEESLTQGQGPGGYLSAYLRYLHHYPLRTKMLTSGALAGLQELLASWIAQDRSKHGHFFSSRIPKMMIYGAFISAPMGHLMIKILQNLFAGRTSLRAKVLQILVSNLIVAPIQNSIYLVSMAIIAGARTFHQVRATVRAGFWPVMRVSWIASPIALAFAQQFLPQEAWVPFFNFIAFVIGTYVNSHTKKKRLAALRKRRSEEGGSSTEYRTEYRRESRED